ncbi:MAG: SGNH/GDSL hydrolase family protein [Muribaculaceae bacterium]|nr:SGNH/GDSL hydrolase family protein [Muribaculaceae bacterium]
MRKGYFTLWLLLAVAFALFTLLSSFDDFHFLGVHLKSSGMSDALFADVEETVEGDSVTDSIAPVEEEIKSKFPVEVDTAAKTILFIGDSMLDGLSPRLSAYAAESGHTLYSVIWYSSSTEQWGKSDRLEKYIKDLHPSYIFICLGSNELMIKDIKEKRTKYVKTLVNTIDTIPFLWIGPPNWREDTGINDMLQENIPEGSFFLSNGMTFKRRKDGAHPTVESAALWMDSVARWMPDHSNHPIIMNFPGDKKARPKRIFIHQPEN